MTSPESGNRTGRIAGVALLGLAAVALVLGLVTVFGGNGDGPSDGNGEEQPPRPTATRSSTTPRPPSSASTTIRPPSSSTSTTAPTTTTTTTGQPPGGDGNGEPAKSTPIRVLNNSKIKGLAANAKADFEADGWQVVEVGNYSATNVPTTTAYFRPGTAEEAAAKALAATFGMEAAPRIPEISGMGAGVVVIVTNDYTGAPGSGGGKNEG
jgi:cytoskeletal protein RodZ